MSDASHMVHRYCGRIQDLYCRCMLPLHASHICFGPRHRVRHCFDVSVDMVPFIYQSGCVVIVHVCFIFLLKPGNLLHCLTLHGKWICTLPCLRLLPTTCYATPHRVCLLHDRGAASALLGLFPYMNLTGLVGNTRTLLYLRKLSMSNHSVLFITMTRTMIVDKGISDDEGVLLLMTDRHGFLKI